MIVNEISKVVIFNMLLKLFTKQFWVSCFDCVMKYKIRTTMLKISYTSLTNRSHVMRLGFVNFTHYLHEFVKFPKAECIFKLIGL